MSMLCITMVDALRLRYIPRKVQTSSSFRRDTPRAAAPPVPRGVKDRVKPTGEGTPVQCLGNRECDE
jgi:hypothetical protein